MTNSIYRRVLQHKRGEIEGFAAKYGCNRLVYYEGFDDVRKAIDPREAIETLGSKKENRTDRVQEPALGGLGREVGFADGISRRVDQKQIV